MPLYQYNCDKCGEQVERRVSIEARDDPCPHTGCGGQLRRHITPVKVIFEGQGWTRNRWTPNSKGQY